MDRHDKRKPGIMRRINQIKERTGQNTVFQSQNEQKSNITTDCLENAENSLRNHQKSHMEESMGFDERNINYDQIEPIPFTHNNMVDLLYGIRAGKWIEDFFLTATNFTPDIPLLRDLLHLHNLVCEISPIYDEDKDYDEQPYIRILEDDSLNIYDKAALLMGEDPAGVMKNERGIWRTQNRMSPCIKMDEDTDTPTPLVWFSVADMINLIRAYDAFQSLKDLVSLTGGIDPQNRIIVWLESIEMLLKDLSPLYAEDDNQDMQYFEMLLADNSLDLPYRARMLLGSQKNLEIYKEPTILQGKTGTDIPLKYKGNEDVAELNQPFTEKNMTDLLTAIYAYESLDEVLEMFTGTYIDNDIIYGLCRLKEILNSICPRYHRELDDDTAENLEYYHTLKSLDIGLQDKARWMMGVEH